MTTILIIVAVVAVVYMYAAVAFYYGFKKWNPMCGCNGTVCGVKKPSQEEFGIGERSDIRS
jgi:hypothetical protein